VLSLEDTLAQARELIDRASDNPDFGTAMLDLIEARRIMDTAGIPGGLDIRKKWEIVYGAVLDREEPESLSGSPPEGLYV